jgi:glycosyltransferase involved in cell wall biosynthesis
MISIVVPTRNRAHTLRLVAASYYQQAGVDEIVFVDDAGSDDTAQVVGELAAAHPGIATVLVRNERRLGAAGARNVGVSKARNEHILFCDDDEYLMPGYATTCLEKLRAYGAGAVSGRNVYMLEGESPAQAVARFGFGLRRGRPFNYLLAERVNAAVHTQDITVPYTHSIIVTRRSDLLSEPFDPFYARGNGYREESDYQMRLFLGGKPIYVTNDAHCVHLPPSLVRTGGQRTSLLWRVYWSVYYTNYFYRKYYDAYAKRVGIAAPRSVALTVFALFAVYRETLRPFLRAAALALLSRKAPAMAATG